MTPTTRFRPRDQVVFAKPLAGPSGAQLLSYRWAYQFEEYVDKRGEDRVRRVSDWGEAEQSGESGRMVVHQFVVREDDGKTSFVSLEGALRIMGYLKRDEEGALRLRGLASTLKTRAKLAIQLESAKAQSCLWQERFQAITLLVKDVPEPDIRIRQAFPASPNSTALMAYVEGDTGEFQVFHPATDGDSHTRQAREQARELEARNTVSEAWKARQAAAMLPESLRSAVRPTYGFMDDLEKRIKRADARIRSAEREAALPREAAWEDEEAKEDGPVAS